MALELTDIVRRYGAAYQARYRLLPHQRRALQDIEHCQTEALGGQILVCPECEHVAYRYHSCRNRHCPKCQHAQAQDWLCEQRACLLNVPYVLLTFTLPAALRPLARRHPRRRRREPTRLPRPTHRAPRRINPYSFPTCKHECRTPPLENMRVPVSLSLLDFSYNTM